MAVEIGTLVLKGRFGAARGQEAAPREEVKIALERMRRDLLQEIEDKFETAARRAWER